MALEMMRQVLEARGAVPEDNARLREIAALFGGPAPEDTETKGRTAA